MSAKDERKVRVQGLRRMEGHARKDVKAPDPDGGKMLGLP